MREVYHPHFTKEKINTGRSTDLPKVTEGERVEPCSNPATWLWSPHSEPPSEMASLEHKEGKGRGCFSKGLGLWDQQKEKGCWKPGKGNTPDNNPVRWPLLSLLYKGRE